MSFIRKPFNYSYKNYAIGLIAVNIIVFVIISIFKRFGNYYVELYLALLPEYTIKLKWLWQVFTYQFLHGGIWHLFFNMLALFFFGIPLEKRMGSKEFLLFYLLCGTLCGVIACGLYYYLFLYTSTRVIVIGASGAIFALLFAFAVLYPDAKIYIWGILPMPAPLLILIYAAIELYSAFFVSDNTAHAVHLAGLVVAWLYVRIRYGIKPLKVWFNRR
ncbi:MAG: glpG protein [Treponema sp.]|nr:MAG: glpG protein [Treponema sp.]